MFGLDTKKLEHKNKLLERNSKPLECNIKKIKHKNKVEYFTTKVERLESDNSVSRVNKLIALVKLLFEVL